MADDYSEEIDRDTLVELKLNSAGFSGSDVGELLPDFMAERRVTVGLTWWPAVDGPESWTLLIASGLTAGAFLKKFAERLAEDLYGWTKSKVVAILARKRHPLGNVTIEFSDVTLTYEVLPANEQELASLVSNLAVLLDQIDPTKGQLWIATYDETGEKWLATRSDRLRHRS